MAPNSLTEHNEWVPSHLTQWAALNLDPREVRLQKSQQFAVRG